VIYLKGQKEHTRRRESINGVELLTYLGWIL